MNRKRVLVTGVVVFVAYMVMAVLVHGFWLGPTYASLTGDVWRPEAELMANAWIMHSTTVIFCFVFAYLFARGYRGGGWREGVWYGFASGRSPDAQGPFGTLKTRASRAATDGRGMAIQRLSLR